VTAMEEVSRLGVKSQEYQKILKYLSNEVARSLEEQPVRVSQQKEDANNHIGQEYIKTGLKLPETLRAQLFHDVYDEVFGYGPIQVLLDDAEITEVMVNGPKQVFIERNGKLIKTNVTLENDSHVIRIIERIVQPLGRLIDPDHPTVDARLPDGSRVNAIIPPVAIDGPSITIRKFSKEKLTVEQLIEFGSMTPELADFLQACVASRLNIIISGGTGSGKTTLLNILSGFIPEEERIVTIEDAAELQLRQEHIVRLETKHAGVDGQGAVTIRDLVRNSLRMRPNRIVVGEVRGGEALDMLQAMNTGHDGSMTTLHANTPRDGLSRLETMTLMSGIDFPIRVVREQIASAVDLIVQQSRMRDGSRKITQVTEIVGMEGDTVVMNDLFKFEEKPGVDPLGKVEGELKPTGIRPLFEHRLVIAGFKLKPEVYGVNIAEMLAANRRPSRRGR